MGPVSPTVPEHVRVAFMIERLEWMAAYDRDPGTTLELLHLLAAADVVWWVNVFVETYDPRRKRYLPMHLWPRQEEFLKALHEAVTTPHELLVEKSRDVGVTWLAVAYAANRWLFSPGFKTAFVANLAELVDVLYDSDSILEKVRILLRGLPEWMLPKGFSYTHHSLHYRIINPANQNEIVGRRGKQAGRGGRASLMFIDEAAHLENPMAVNAATSATSDCRVWASSVSGNANWFANRRNSGDIKIFRFHWTDDPRKASDPGWKAATIKRVGKVTFASEYDIDYGASVTDLLIELQWIEAAKWLWKHPDCPKDGQAITGGDVGAGGDKTVRCTRKGGYTLVPQDYAGADSINAAHWLMNGTLSDGSMILVYDSLGVGHGVTSAFMMERRNIQQQQLHIVPHAGSNSPTNRVWPDGMKSSEKFGNKRAEVWWLGREACRRSYEKRLFMEGDIDQGIDHPWDEVAALPPHDLLCQELNMPTYFHTEKGKIMIQSKKEMPKSPDYADSWTMTFDFVTPEDPDPDDIVVERSHYRDDY